MIPDCRVIVTGAGGSGCGRAIARQFAKNDAAVVVSDIHENGGYETVRLIEGTGERAVFFRAEQQVRDLIAFAEQTYGRVTVLANNASAPFRPGDETEHWSDPLFCALEATQSGKCSKVYSERG
jgi:NAD(P)-dependent dehydrogenase (short-subunit alcohol dehydrogenase family)